MIEQQQLSVDVVHYADEDDWVATCCRITRMIGRSRSGCYTSSQIQWVGSSSTRQGQSWNLASCRPSKLTFDKRTFQNSQAIYRRVHHEARRTTQRYLRWMLELTTLIIKKTETRSEWMQRRWMRVFS